MLIIGFCLFFIAVMQTFFPEQLRVWGFTISSN